MRYNADVIKAELFVGKSVLNKLETAYNSVCCKRDLYALDSLSLNLVCMVEFVVRVCDHICSKNGRNTQCSSAQDKVNVAASFGLLTARQTEHLVYLITIRNKIVHQNNIVSEKEVCCAVYENLKLITEIFNAFEKLVA